jgi:hypothetical protein
MISITTLRISELINKPHYEVIDNVKLVISLKDDAFINNRTNRICQDWSNMYYRKFEDGSYILNMAFFSEFILTYKSLDIRRILIQEMDSFQPSLNTTVSSIDKKTLDGKFTFLKEDICKELDKVHNLLTKISKDDTRYLLQKIFHKKYIDYILKDINETDLSTLL